MRIFLAGATGLIGSRLIPLMLAEGHVVAAMTRTQGKIDGLRAAGVTPVPCDLFDPKSLAAAVKDFRPDLVVHQVTDLPDEIGKLAEFLPRRYGHFYGPGTFYENAPPPAPRIQVDDAARRTMPFLAGPRGTFTITESDAP